MEFLTNSLLNRISILHFEMEKFNRDLYNLNEWLLLRFFRVVTGLRLAFNPNLETIYLVNIDEVQANTIEIIQNQVSDEFGVQIQQIQQIIDHKKAVRGSFLNTSHLTLKLNDQISRDKGIAIMAVSNYWLAPTNLLISRIFHSFQPLLGITYLVYGICFITTLNGKLPEELIRFAAIHEVGHLLGKHGYPLEWLLKRKKSNQ